MSDGFGYTQGFASLDLFLSAPVSSITVLLCSVVWFYMWNNRVENSVTNSSYEKVVNKREWWRLITAAYTHLGILHLVFNMMATWNLSSLERAFGTLEFCKQLFVLVIGQEALCTALYWVMIKRFRRSQYKKQEHAGYSGVIFGQFAIVAVVFQSPYAIMGIQVPAMLSPFVALFITQLILWRASFLCHLSGLIIGYLIAFSIKLGTFGWFSDYLFYCAFSWFVIILLWSLKSTTSFPLPCIKIGSHAVAPRIRMVNGAVVHDPTPQNRDTAAGVGLEENGVSAGASSGGVDIEDGDLDPNLPNAPEGWVNEDIDEVRETV